ncbi:MAG: NUDIX domain-containing protein [Desulfarculaceae bacterium]|nr:NUDIX domain-containing protein [Desulfarculaceae bacterium]
MDIGHGVKAVLYRENKVLLLIDHNGKADLPGGRVEPGEDLREALRREVREETGLNIKNLATWRGWHLEKGRLYILGTTFFCEEDGGDFRLSPEHGDYEWVSFRDLKGRLPDRRPFVP